MGKKVLAILMLVLLGVLSLLVGCTGKSNRLEPDAFDLWTVGDPAIERAHQTRTGGKTAKKSITASIGLLNEEFDAYHFQDKDDSLSVVMDIRGMIPSSGDIPVMLEIREVHEGNPKAFGYTVLVDNRPVYFRTYEELVQAPLNYFIAVDRKLIHDPGKVNITIRSESDSPFNISDIRAYGDFYQLASNQGLLFPMKLHTYVNDKKVEKAAEVISKYKPCEDFSYGLYFGTSYLQLKKEEIFENISSFLSQAKSNSSPFSIMFSRWWGHTAKSPDGMGGYFGDLKYNQILYSYRDELYYVTTPNQWGNTPWPSMNNQYTNEIAKQKLVEASQFLADQYALMQVSRGEMPSGTIVMEEGSGFWPEGDFSYDIVSEAKEDGLILNPEDGLNKTEKLWMQKNIAVYNNFLATAYIKGLGTNAVVVDQDIITYPNAQLFDNIYTHNLQATLWPSNDDRIPGWMGGISKNMWSSSEMYVFTDQRHNDYSLNFGKLGCVNMWVPMVTANDFTRYLQSSYANGIHFLYMFGPEQAGWDVPEQIVRADHLKDLPVGPTPEYMQCILDIDYFRDYQPDIITKPIPEVQYKGIKAADNSRVKGIEQGFIYQENPSVPGEVICSLMDKNHFRNGLILYIEGKTISGNIDVFAGEYQSQMTKIEKFEMSDQKTWFNLHSPFRIDLGEMVKGKKQVFVKFILNGTDGGTSMRAIKAFLPWDKKTGPIEFREDTHKEKRLQNTWIQYRVVADRMLTRYILKKGTSDEISQKAQDLFAKGFLMDGIRLLEKEISEVLPARYAIKAYGRLGKYPLMIQLPNPSDYAVVKIHSSCSKKSKIEFFVDKPMEINIKPIDGGKDLYKFEKTGDLVYEIEKQETGTREIKILVSPKNDNPLLNLSSLEGKVLQSNDKLLTVECQDPDLGEFSASGIILPIRSDCSFSRKLYGSEMITKGKRPEINDKVFVKLDEGGNVTETTSEYGLIRGVIKMFTKSQLQSNNPHNGIVELENGMIFELSFNKDHSILDLPMLKGLAIQHDVNKVFNAIQSGLKVEIVFCPYTYKGSNFRIISMSAL